VPRAHGTVQGLLRTLGVLGDKHVPATYLRASEHSAARCSPGSWTPTAP
jgi:hypothetical protein